MVPSPCAIERPCNDCSRGGWLWWERRRACVARASRVQSGFARSRSIDSRMNGGMYTKAASGIEAKASMQESSCVCGSASRSRKNTDSSRITHRPPPQPPSRSRRILTPSLPRTSAALSNWDGDAVTMLGRQGIKGVMSIASNKGGLRYPSNPIKRVLGGAVHSAYRPARHPVCSDERNRIGWRAAFPAEPADSRWTQDWLPVSSRDTQTLRCRFETDPTISRRRTDAAAL